MKNNNSFRPHLLSCLFNSERRPQRIPTSLSSPPCLSSCTCLSQPVGSTVLFWRALDIGFAARLQAVRVWCRRACPSQRSRRLAWKEHIWFPHLSTLLCCAVWRYDVHKSEYEAGAPTPEIIKAKTPFQGGQVVSY